MLPAFTRKYGVATATATHVSVPLIKRGATDYAVGADWTPAAGDVRISKDGGAWANITNLPTADSAAGNGGSAVWVFQFTATELQCKVLRVMVSDATTKAIEDQYFCIETVGNGSAMYPSDPTADNTDQETRFLNASKGIVTGTVGNGTNNTTTVSISGGSGACSPAPTVTDQFKGRVLMFAIDTVTVALRGQGFSISGNSTTQITCAAGDALTTAPQDGDKFTIT